MLGHLVYNRYVPENDGYVRAAPANAGWMRRVLGALFRRH
jgi:hypothetical protein